MSFLPKSFGSKLDYRHGAAAIPLDVVAEGFTDEANRYHGTFSVRCTRHEWLCVHEVRFTIDTISSASVIDPHGGVVLGELNPIILTGVFDSEADGFGKLTNRHHGPTTLKEGKLIGERNILPIEGNFRVSHAVVAQIHAVPIGNHGVLVLVGPGSERRGAVDNGSAVVCFLGEDGTEGISVLNEEFASVYINPRIGNTQSVDKYFRRILQGGINGNIRLNRVVGARGAVPVNVQGVLSLIPGIAKVISPIAHDELIAGSDVDADAQELQAEDLAHVLLGLDADLVKAVHIGTDAIHSGVVHVDGSRAVIQVDTVGTSSAGGAGQQTKHHDDRHQGRNKPCFFHCTFLQYNIVFCGTEMCCARDGYCYIY